MQQLALPLTSSPKLFERVLRDDEPRALTQSKQRTAGCGAPWEFPWGINSTLPFRCYGTDKKHRKRRVACAFGWASSSSAETSSFNAGCGDLSTCGFELAKSCNKRVCGRCSPDGPNNPLWVPAPASWYCVGGST